MKKAKKKKPNLSSEAALKRALANDNIVFSYAYQPLGRDYFLIIRETPSLKALWQDSLRRLGITKRKPLKGVVRRLKKAVR